MLFYDRTDFLEGIELSRCGNLLKGTLMQIWKSPYMLVFTLKQYAESFAFLILGIIELFTCEVCKFLKKWANFLHIW